MKIYPMLFAFAADLDLNNAAQGFEARPDQGVENPHVTELIGLYFTVTPLDLDQEQVIGAVTDNGVEVANPKIARIAESLGESPIPEIPINLT